MTTLYRGNAGLYTCGDVGKASCEPVWDSLHSLGAIPDDTWGSPTTPDNGVGSSDANTQQCMRLYSGKYLFTGKKIKLGRSGVMVPDAAH